MHVQSREKRPSFGELCNKQTPSRSHSFFVRAISSEVSSTQSLVEAFNAERTQKRLKAHREFLRKHIDCFRDASSCCNESWVDEFLNLAEAKKRSPEDDKILKEFFQALCAAVYEEKFVDGKFIRAAHRAMQQMDPQFFKSHVSNLLTLVKHLMAKLTPERNSFSEPTYPSHSVVLLALNQTLTVLHKVAPQEFDPDHVNGPYQMYKAKLAEIREQDPCYSLLYLVLLAEQRVEMLSVEKVSYLSHTFERMDYGANAVRTMIGVFASFWTGSFDPEEVDDVKNLFKKAAKSKSIGIAPWFRGIMELDLAGQKYCQDPTKADNFEEWYNMVLGRLDQMKSWDDKKALLYGVITQLRLLMVEEKREDINKNAATKLLSLGGLIIKQKAEAADRDIIHAVISAFEAAASHPNIRSLAIELLSEWGKTKGNPMNMVSEWIGDEVDVEARLIAAADSGVVSKADVDSNSTLFASVLRAMGLEYLTENCNNNRINDIKSGYQSYLFLEYNEDSRSFNICCDVNYSLEESINEADRIHETDVANPSPTIISSNAIVDGSAFAVDSKPIQSILVIGEKGMGKTCLGKSIAHRWATTETIGSFEVVYYVQTSEIRDTKYNNAKDRMYLDLETVIANLCNTIQLTRDIKVYRAIKHQIALDLEKTTTLLIFDGLGNVDSAAETIINEAFDNNNKCKVLLLTNRKALNQRPMPPYERTFTCIGLNDVEVEKLIKHELTEAQKNSYKTTNPCGLDDLLANIKSSEEIRRTLYSPTTVHWLCCLWQEQRRQGYPDMDNFARKFHDSCDIRRRALKRQRKQICSDASDHSSNALENEDVDDSI